MFSGKEIDQIQIALEELRRNAGAEVWPDVDPESELSAKQLFKMFGFEVGKTVHHGNFVTFRVRNFKDECPEWHIFSE